MATTQRQGTMPNYMHIIQPFRRKSDSTLDKCLSKILLSTPSSTLLYLHRCHGQDLAPFLLPQLGTDSAVDATAHWIARLVNEYASVVLESDGASVASLHPVPRPHNDGVSDISSLDLGSTRCHASSVGFRLFLDDDNDAVSYGSMSLLPNDHGAFDKGGARVVDAVKHRL